MADNSTADPVLAAPAPALLCNAAAIGEGDSYSLSWQIAGLFIVLATSGLGMAVSMFLASYSAGTAYSKNTSSASHNHNPPLQATRVFVQKVLQLCKMFGIGIIAGTAWIHLLPDAFAQFSDPCLPEWWATYGTNWVGVFGLLAAFGVQLIEMAGHSHVKKKHSHSHHHHDHHDHHDHDHLELSESANHLARGEDEVGSQSPFTQQARRPSIAACPIEEVECCESECDAHVTMGLEQNLRAIHSPATEVVVRRALSATTFAPAKPESEQEILGELEQQQQQVPSIQRQQEDARASSTIVLGLPTVEVVNSRRDDAIKRINTLVLECGILSHSLIIGLALGVTSDSTFPSLLVAISFHQLFEGMALGVLVSDTNLSLASKLILGGLYPITTPVGIAIGILLHQSYTNSPSMILAQGILASMSAGILIYNTYCELVGGEINHNPAFDRFEQGFKVLCFLFMYLGAFAMALVGVWA